MSLTSLVIKLAVKRPRLTSFDKYLFIGPHPDDIEIGAGALVSKLVGMGKKVSFVICLDGRYGDSHSDNLTENELAKKRKEESIQAAKLLGVTDVRFLELSDGGFYEIKELDRALSKVIGDIEPEIILAPDPLTRSECHYDHLAVGTVARYLSYFSNNEPIMKRRGSKAIPLKGIAFYMTDKPDCIEKVSKEDFKKQLAAISEGHVSQYPKGDPMTNSLKLYLSAKSFDMGMRKLSLHGEGYRFLDTIRMHCLPEV